MIPGEIIVKEGSVICNEGRSVKTIKVVNTGDRPIQVGSHFHFFEVNPQMEFDRSAAIGMRLNIISSTAIRFEPGEEKEVELVEFGGAKKLYGFNNLVDGDLNIAENFENAIKKAGLNNFKTK